MQQLYIRTTNSSFRSLDDGAEYATAELAMERGVQGALQIAGEELTAVTSGASVEVLVERQGGSAVLRSVVTVVVAPLLMTDCGTEVA